MNIGGQAGTSSMPEPADITISHPLQCALITAISILPVGTNMSMAIHRTSANVVPAMLNPVAKLSRVAKFGSGRSKLASSTGQAPAPASRPQPADTSSTADQVHTAFEYARVALGSSVAMDSSMAQSSTEVQSGVQQGSAYAQVEQQAGQALDITA